MGPPFQESRSESLLEFGSFELDLRSGELQRGGETIELAALPTRLLRYLAANRGRVVAKRELALEIWGAANVAEATVQQAVRAVRLAVGDDGRAQRVIRTASGVGYRFVAPIRSDDSGPKPPGSLPFVGRRALLDSFEQSLAGLGTARGALLLVSGPAGIGKSRMLDEIGRLAASRGMAIVRGGERSPEGASPFWPWVDVFSELSAIRPVDELRHRVPYLLGLGSDEGRRVTQPERFRHFAIAAQCVRRAADHGSVVILLEDLHRAGTWAWELLERVATTSLNAPLLVVATHRPIEAGPDPSIARIRDRVAATNGVNAVEVGPLGDVESAYLVELASRRALPAEHVAAISSVTGGNPLIAVEFARLLPTSTEPLVESEWQVFVGASIPRLLEARLAHLDAEVRSPLVVAAAIGSTFDTEILLHASPEDDPWRALKVAMDERLVAELKPGSNVYRFAHALIRDTFYSELTLDPERCRRVHLRIADALLAVDPTRHSEVAHHTFAAGPLAGETRIAHVAERAAQSAAQGGEVDAAFAIYEQALSALAGCGTGDPEIRCAMSVAAGELGVRSGMPDAARAVLDEAIALARGIRRPDLFARAGLARAFRTEIVGTADPAVIALLDEAVAGLDGTSPELVAQLRSRMAIELRYAGDGPERGLRLAAQAIAEAEASGDVRTLARVLEDASLVRWSVTDPIGWLELNERIEQVAREAGDTELVFQGSKGIATACLELCRRDDFDREVDRCAETADTYPSPFLRAVVAGLRASQAFLEGDFARAEHQVLASAANGLEELAPLTAAQIFYHRLETGRLAELEAATRQFMRASPGIVTWQVALARLLVDDGRLEEARRVVADLPPLDRVAKDRNWFTAMAMLTECAAALADRELAGRLYDELEPHAAVGGVLGNGSVFYGTGAHFLGMLCSLLERLDDADRHLARAFQLHDGLRSEPWRLRTRLEQARVLAGRGKRKDAAARAADVARRATALGMLRCAEAAEGIIASARAGTR